MNTRSCIDSYEADYEWDQKHTEGWVVANDPGFPAWVAAFARLDPVGGGAGEGDKISGAVAKRDMVKSKLPNPVLSKYRPETKSLLTKQTHNIFHVCRRIWSLADQDKDGMLTRDEYCLANYLVRESSKSGSSQDKEC